MQRHPKTKSKAGLERNAAAVVLWPLCSHRPAEWAGSSLHLYCATSLYVVFAYERR